ncbi:twin-arginine translocase TatA/TatE family subunit [Aliiglaciecola sp. LCG003]|uniref:twin-arginine translocase TatA/TatE family subunit n=1 Tax=Aliiglaciecola sp. LCG003 TaxID=3053655 RepID=UPI0025744818|nr:twin-arginine translocase TatA/TatE family subunit [Aliiglaciecola sp. LCG003]WJG09100.1 twin-arginine translocase TatA/TatE family subunit [Aliiglaciecola sp. LCG003]
MGNIGWAQLLIVLVIVLLLFGTKKLRSLGGDLGSAIKGFKKAVSDKDADFEDESNKKVEDKSTQAPIHQKETPKQTQKPE